MKIEDAQKLVIGNKVRCPEDRGDKPYTGLVDFVGSEVYKNIHDEEYINITVSRIEGNRKTIKSVWPSNRLTK